MECFICNENIDDDFKALLPCCNTTVHALCLIPFAENHYQHNKTNVICNCGEILHRFTPQAYAYNDNVWLSEDEVKEKMDAKMVQPAFKKLILAGRLRVRNRNKAHREFNTFLNAKGRIFKDAVHTYEDTIKRLKKEALDEIVKSDEYKKLRGAIGQVTRIVGKIVADFGVTEREASIQINTRRRQGYWRWNSTRWKIARKLRLRI